MNRSPPAISAAADAPLRRDTGNPRYRPDIDGLRAIAVLSVLFFHVGFAGFCGGWVGVDVFFVISGFLITRLIKDEIEDGSFSFAGFYTRRARRLFASFIFIVAATFITGSLVFDRIYLQHFAGEVVYALIAASNFFYWLDGGYFGVAEQYKPLLHTWSLGVEEQFYLIWPLTIVLSLRYFRRYLWPLLTLAALVSLFIAEYFFYLGKERAAFLLLPGRIFEFAIGAMLVWLIRYQRTNQRALEGALLFGIALILLAVFRFTTSTPFPTLYALVPCLGSALAIFGGTSTNLRWILGNRLMVGIGKISYSLYLIHWPVIVFYSYHRLAPLDHLEQALICMGSILGAALMYVFIEQPFRDPRRVKFSSGAALALTCTASLMILLVPASIVWAKGSLIWRGSVAEVTAAQLQQIEELRKQDEVDDLLRDRPFASTVGRAKLMFVGDSHSGDVAAAMFLNLGNERYDYARSGFGANCFSSVDRRPWILRITGAESPCESQIDALRKSRSFAEANYLFIVDRWSGETIKGFGEGLMLLRALTKARIIVVGQNATFPSFDDSLRYLDRTQLQRLNSELYQQQSSVDIQINEQLRRLATANGLGFIDRQSLVCSQSRSLCEVVAPDGRFLYSDSNHWTYAGRSVFGKLLVQRFGYLLASRPDVLSAAQP
jgi:peptidoglycan/LPS O-acetylase OafA/YrhL